MIEKLLTSPSIAIAVVILIVLLCSVMKVTKKVFGIILLIGGVYALAVTMGWFNL